MEQDLIVALYDRFLNFLIASPALGGVIVASLFILALVGMGVLVFTHRSKVQDGVSKSTDMALVEMAQVLTGINNTMGGMSNAISELNGRIAVMQSIMGDRRPYSDQSDQLSLPMDDMSPGE